MGVAVEIPIHETIIFDLESTGADCFLEQHPSSIFFIRRQLVNRLLVPAGSACWRWNTLPFQSGSNLSQAVTGKMPFKYPAHHLSLIGIHCQFTIKASLISVTLAASHFVVAIPKASPKPRLDGFTFLYHVHYNFPPINKNTAVKPLRRNAALCSLYKKLTDHTFGGLPTYHGYHGRGIIIGLQEIQSYQRFAGRQQGVLYHLHQKYLQLRVVIEFFNYLNLSYVNTLSDVKFLKFLNCFLQQLFILTFRP